MARDDLRRAQLMRPGTPRSLSTRSMLSSDWGLLRVGGLGADANGLQAEAAQEPAGGLPLVPVDPPSDLTACQSARTFGGGSGGR